MSILVRHRPRNLTREKYEEVSRRMEEAGDWSPEGLDVHVLFGSEGSTRVSEIWDSEEQFQAFGERIFPVLSEVGVEADEPEVWEVHELERR
jgi:hypothetical protein